MILVVSLISTLFILLILVLLLEYRSRNRRTLARRMRYYAGGMDTQEKPKEKRPLAERFMDLLRSSGKFLSSIRHADGLSVKMQQAGLPIAGTEFLIILGIIMPLIKKTTKIIIAIMIFRLTFFLPFIFFIST